MRALVAGWFSFEDMGATAGDLLCRDLLCEWLDSSHFEYDVAVAKPFTDGVDLSTIDPIGYTHLVFVCGPLGNGWPVSDLFQRFSHCTCVGLNLTMLDQISNWNPFELLIERDSDRTTRPDMTFLTERNEVPVVGLILAHPQKEYGNRGRHAIVNEAITRLLDSREVAVVPIDTRLDHNATGLRSPREVESLIGRMDAVVTTRLHGTALALKNGVPVLAIDPISGSAKVSRQAKALRWPILFGADSLEDQKLQEALDFCLTSDARLLAEECAAFARSQIRDVKTTLLSFLQLSVPAVKG